MAEDKLPSPVVFAVGARVSKQSAFFVWWGTEGVLRNVIGSHQSKVS